MLILTDFAREGLSKIWVFLENKAEASVQKKHLIDSCLILNASNWSGLEDERWVELSIIRCRRGFTNHQYHREV